MAKRTQQFAFELEALEQRVLLSGDGLSGVALAVVLNSSTDEIVIEEPQNASLQDDFSAGSDVEGSLFDGLDEEVILVPDADANPLEDDRAAGGDDDVDASDTGVIDTGDADSDWLEVEAETALPEADDFSGTTDQMIESLVAANPPPSSETVDSSSVSGDFDEFDDYWSNVKQPKNNQANQLFEDIYLDPPTPYGTLFHN